MKELEAVKIFANTNLALRVICLNNLDIYVQVKGLHSQAIIEEGSLAPHLHKLQQPLLAAAAIFGHIRSIKIKQKQDYMRRNQTIPLA